MKVFWVLAYDRYYPSRDNFVKSFETYEEAEKYIEEAKKEEWSYDFFDIINISERL